MRYYGRRHRRRRGLDRLLMHSACSKVRAPHTLLRSCRNRSGTARLEPLQVSRAAEANLRIAAEPRPEHCNQLLGRIAWRVDPRHVASRPGALAQH
jgi:hypothetical protein